MPKVLILGAGKIGALIPAARRVGSYEVHLADVSGEAANAVVNAHASRICALTTSTLPTWRRSMRTQEPSSTP